VSSPGVWFKVLNGAAGNTLDEAAEGRVFMYFAFSFSHLIQYVSDSILKKNMDTY
jgi:hypothetical protein